VGPKAVVSNIFIPLSYKVVYWKMENKYRFEEDDRLCGLVVNYTDRATAARHRS
jgi:hypothetical protein